MKPKGYTEEIYTEAARQLAVERAKAELIERERAEQAEGVRVRLRREAEACAACKRAPCSPDHYEALGHRRDDFADAVAAARV